MNASDCFTLRCFAFAVLLANTVLGCDRLQPNENPAAPPHLVWPAPPDAAHIELERVFGRASDLGIRQAWWKRLGNFVSGTGEPHLVRPAGVAVRGDTIAVADTGDDTVQLYDLGRGQQRALDDCLGVAFREPVAVAFLAQRLYVSDAGGGRIAVFELDGTCASAWPLGDGARPGGLAADASRGRLYVAEPGAHRIVAFDEHGTIVLQIGRRGTATGEFNYPGWLAVDPAGRLYVTDSMNFRVEIFAPDGSFVSAFGREGDGSGDFARPKGVGLDKDGHVYVVDALFDTVQIFDPQGTYLLNFGERGTQSGQFWLPAGLAVAAGDRIYVADAYNSRVQVFRYLGSGQ